MAKKLYEREEKVLKKKITHTLLLDSLRSKISALLRGGEFKLSFENSRNGRPQDTETLDLSLSFGKDKEFLPIVNISTSMTAEDIAKLLALYEIVKDCEDADAVCSDKEIILTKVIYTEED